MQTGTQRASGIEWELLHGTCRCATCCKSPWTVNLQARQALATAIPPPTVTTGAARGPILAGAVCRTPCYGKVYDALPAESRMCNVQLLRPVLESQRKSCVLHLAATGEHAYKQRLRLGEPLLAQARLQACLAVQLCGGVCICCMYTWQPPG